MHRAAQSAWMKFKAAIGFVGAAFVAAAVYLFFEEKERHPSTPVLFHAGDPTIQAEIVRRLEQQKIPYSYSGTHSVSEVRDGVTINLKLPEGALVIEQQHKKAFDKIVKQVYATARAKGK